MTTRTEEIDRILYEEWDPIGIRDVAPRDEYRSYVGSVDRLLEREANIDEITATLRHHRTMNMGLRADDARDRAVAERLHALRSTA